MDVIFLTTGPLFLLVLIGYLFERLMPKENALNRAMCNIGLGSCQTTTSILNSYALYLALPAVIVVSLAKAEDVLTRADIPIVVLTLAALLVWIAILHAIGKALQLSPAMHNTLVWCGFFGNVAYIGIPFITSLIPGTDAYVSIFIALHVAVAFTIGLYLLEKSIHTDVAVQTILWRVFKNPLVLSTLVGLCLVLFHIVLPTSLMRTLEMIAVSASPVTLVALGAFMAREWRHDHASMHVAFGLALLKSVALPVAFFFSIALSTAHTAQTVSLLLMAMPVGVTNFALAEKYPMDKKITADAIILGTLLSLVTLPILAYLFS